MGLKSRNKGKAGERELARFLSERGFEASRGQQHKGSNDSPDVVCQSLPFHIECKRTETFRLYAAMQQAIDDAAGSGKVPMVVHRKNGEDWVAVIKLADLLAVISGAESG